MPTPNLPDGNAPTYSSSRPPDRPPSIVHDFEFLNFSHPSEAKAVEARRTVRSHVTRQQHQRENMNTAAARKLGTSPVRVYGSAASEPQTARPNEVLWNSLSDGYGNSIILAARSDSAITTTASIIRQSSPQAQVEIAALYPASWRVSLPKALNNCRSEIFSFFPH